MATRPARPKATKLYPSKQKTRTDTNASPAENEDSNTDQSNNNKHDADVSNPPVQNGIPTEKQVAKAAVKRKEKAGLITKPHSDTKTPPSSADNKATKTDKEKSGSSAKSTRSVRSTGKKTLGSQVIKNEKVNEESVKNTTLNKQQTYSIDKTGVITATKRTGNANIKAGAVIQVPEILQNGNQETPSRMWSEKSSDVPRRKGVAPRATKLQDKAKPSNRTNATPMMMLLNTKGHDDRNGSVMERRRHIIHNVIQKYTPSLILLQHFQFPEITNKFWSANPLPSTYRYIGNEVVSMMYDHTLVDIQDVQITEFQNTLEGLQRHPNNKLKRAAPADFNPFPRMCARQVIMKRGPKLQFICISWHGKFELKGHGNGKIKHAMKLEYFEYLMEFLRIVKEKVKQPILIGGNFNVDMYSIEHLVRPPFQLCIYDASMRRTVPGIVDYCIISEELSLNEITWVSLRENTTAYQPNGVLDYDPVRAYIAAKPGKGANPKGRVNPKWNPGPPQ